MRYAAAVLFVLGIFVIPDVVRGDGPLYRCFDADGVLVALGEPVRVTGGRCEVVTGTETSARARRVAASSARRPTASFTTTLVPFVPPTPTARLPANRRLVLDVRRAHRRGRALFQLPVDFIRAIVKVESNYHPEVVSRTGAVGLMQLMPGTARSMGVANPFDPRQNIFGGTRYLRILANLFHGDLVMTIAAYNAGEGAVMRYRGVPPYDETRRYVQRVLHHYYALRSGSGILARSALRRRWAAKGRARTRGPRRTERFARSGSRELVLGPGSRIVARPWSRRRSRSYVAACAASRWAPRTRSSSCASAASRRGKGLRSSSSTRAPSTG